MSTSVWRSHDGSKWHGLLKDFRHGFYLDNYSAYIDSSRLPISGFSLRTSIFRARSTSALLMSRSTSIVDSMVLITLQFISFLTCFVFMEIASLLCESRQTGAIMRGGIEPSANGLLTPR